MNTQQMPQLSQYQNPHINTQHMNTQQIQQMHQMAQMQQMQQWQQQQALQQQYQQLLQYQKLQQLQQQQQQQQHPQQQPQQPQPESPHLQQQKQPEDEDEVIEEVEIVNDANGDVVDGDVVNGDIVNKSPNDNFSEESVYSEVYESLARSSQYDDVEFAKKISNLSSDEQFIYTMQRWSYQISELEKSLKYIHEFDANQNNLLHIINMLSTSEKEEKEKAAYHTNTRFENIRLPIGSYIKSPKNQYYLNLGIEAKTLQGCLYIGTIYKPSFISEIMSGGIDDRIGANFASLIARYSNNPSVAIKYYDKTSTELGITLSGIAVKEKPIQEIRITRVLYRTASISETLKQPILPWLQKPCKNIIKLIDHWEDEERSALFMVTEFANCGELLVFIDRYHSLIYRDKKLEIQKIDETKSNSLRDLKINVYRNQLTLSKDGFNAYIELIRYIFQQMVQSIHTLHCQGVVHLDISCENFVLHFDENGQFLVKLIDFGRATKLRKKPKEQQAEEQKDCKYKLEYDKYDFMVSTYTGKCRYMSPESALFLKYKNAQPYNSAKEDIYSLGIVLFCMLTCTLPYNTPFYIEKDPNNPTKYGYLNGNKDCKIDLQTLCDINNPSLKISPSELDSNFATLFQQNGVVSLLKLDCILDYVTYDALDLLNKIFVPNKDRISLQELIHHPFVSTPPNPQLLMKMIKHVADYKHIEFKKQKENMQNAINDINNLYANRLHIQAKYIFYLNKQQELKQQYLTLQQQTQKDDQDKKSTLKQPEDVKEIENTDNINDDEKSIHTEILLEPEPKEILPSISPPTPDLSLTPISPISPASPLRPSGPSSISPNPTNTKNKQRTITPESIFPTITTMQVISPRSSIRSESSFMQSTNASINTSINLAVHMPPDFASPSPPPEPTYTCSPSPEITTSDIISVSSHSNPTSPIPPTTQSNNVGGFVSVNSMNDKENNITNITITTIITIIMTIKMMKMAIKHIQILFHHY